MASDNIDKLTDELLVCWVYYKRKSLEKVGAKAAVDTERARALYGAKLRELATVLVGWDIHPRVAMAAMWAQAAADKHTQGPFPNALGSPNYLRRSLSRYLGMPIEAVVEQTNRTVMVGKIEADYIARLPFLVDYCVQHGPVATAMLTTVPACYRLMFLRHRSKADPRDMAALAIDALAEVDTDARMMAWLESRAMSFNSLAAIANIEEKADVCSPRMNLIDVIASALETAKNGEIMDVLDALERAAMIAAELQSTQV